MHRSSTLQDVPPVLELDDLESDSSSTFSLDSGGAAALLPRSESAGSSSFTSSRTLRRLCLLLHAILVLVHAGLLGIWAGPHLEHRVTFPLDYQDIVSFVITGTTTLVGTIYYSLLIFVAQKMATRRVLQSNTTLTATHDTSAAWAGAGSAIAVLWKQKAVSSSLMTLLQVTAYLMCIMGLHTTTPALFAVQTFNLSQPITVNTQGLPEFDRNFKSSDFPNFSPEDVTGAYAHHVLGFLPWIENMTASEKVGLTPGSLYDTVEVNSGTGNATVSATGFNISCGFTTGVHINWSEATQLWTVKLDNSIGEVDVPYTNPGIIGIVNNQTVPGTAGFPSNVIVLYSTIPVVDSAKQTGPMVQLTPEMPGSVSALQFFLCSQSLISQIATVDTHTHQIVDIRPSFEKDTSRWGPYSGPTAMYSNGSMVDMWASWFNYMPLTGIPRSFFINSTNDRRWFLSVTEQYFIQKFNLLPSNASDGASARPSDVSLHTVENSLSYVVSYMFWIMGHISADGATAIEFDPRNPQQAHQIEYNVPFLLSGNATVQKVTPAGRIDISVIAISIGLVTSICLAALAVAFSWGKSDCEVTVDGIGFLHAIWLFRNNPALHSALYQVEIPTDTNLREAGMVEMATTASSGRRRKSRGQSKK
ncbi:hypothetical protein C8R47DRAFT_1289951 [Mycena vitilis]|nr:hypothetical protein C8R47DRAFT_1289951 [Mycena vitilis]